MRRDSLALYDGFSTVLKGVNSGLAPVSLGRDELAWAVNATFRNNYATSRPGMSKRTLDLSALADQPTFVNGLFQGAIAFERRNQLVTLISGHLYSIDLASGLYGVNDVSPILNSATPPTLDIGPANRYRAWFAEAEDFIIAQDGQSQPWIYDGASSRRSDTFGLNGAREVPVGTAMCYGTGRLVVALADGRQFVVGDIVGGDSGTALYDYRDAVLKFTENTIVNEGGSFAVPINSGPITAIRPIAQVDTSTGQGPVQVLTTSAIFSLNTPTDRTTWKDVTFPLQTVSLVQSGGLSDRATVNVNGDIWTRSFDGIRSFIVARREFSYRWTNAPMSQELVRVISRDDPYQLSYGSAAVFDNRLLMTVNPYRNWGHGVVHRGLAVIDFAPLAYLADQTSPAWEGIWTGLQVLQVLTGNFAGQERCFIFALNTANQIELWELSKSNPFDFDGVKDVPIQWSVETGGLTFPMQPGTESVPSQNLVKLDGGRLFVDEIEGSVTFGAFYRCDQDQCWRDWWSWSVCATDATCGAAYSQSCTTPQTLLQQYRQPFFLPMPREAADTVTHKPYNVGREFQSKLVISGKCRIKRLECVAHVQQEDVVSQPAKSEVCAAVTCGSCQDDFTYQLVTVAQTPVAPGLPTLPANPTTPGTTTPPASPTPPTFIGPPVPGADPNRPHTPTTPPPPAQTGPTLPGLPPFILTPVDPPSTPYACQPFFHGVWTDPGPPDVNGNNHELATSAEIPTGLTSDVFNAWSLQLWQQFSAYAVANSLTVAKAQILINYDGGTADRRYDATQVLSDGFYVSAYGLGYTLVIDWCNTL